MEFRQHSGTIAVFDANDVDTDRIIPARFLSMVTRTGYGELLFNDSRGPEFPLDRPEAQGASILVVGSNFGCGSSREHAVWALQQAGYRAVVARASDDAPAYSDIFRQNAANCGLLLIELPPNEHSVLVDAGSGSTATIDLEAQAITVSESTIRFEINPSTKDALVRGLDLIGSTLALKDEIARFEAESNSFVPRAESVGPHI